ncbi:MAG: restriction endonuclease subunit S [Bacteroidales bacterium]|nr:restriction endonuclease subunit S [Bacteroidales bacterium]MBQ6307379.1 restriction endonuclease subunit S [Bacteroidales bacterium]
MTTPQHIPSDYKPSPLGPIPEDWEVKRLGEICTHFKSGNTITSIDIHDDGLYPVYGGNGLRGYANTFTHDGNYILIGRQGALCGNINYVEGKNYISEHAIAVQTNENMQWLKYKLENWNLNRFSESSAQPGLSVEKLVRYKLVIPTRLEQNKIADILQLWDTAIAKQTALIEQLTLRKRGLMQQLLTGKKRLKGFEGEWKELRLGEIGMFLSNNTLSRDQLNPEKGEVQNVHYGDVLIKYPSILDCSKTVLPFINESAYKDSMTDYVKDGDIIISDTAEDETVGKACEIQKLGNKKVLAGLHTMLLRPKDGVFAPFFLGYYFNSEKYHSKLLPLIQGIKVCSIGKQAIQNTIIEVPSIKEQTAIASVLVNADKEIEIQKQKLAAMQAQKKGLMQVLLTGKRRIL